MKRPLNIILLMTDQLRSDFLGCYGAKHAFTPSIDSLANSGIRFENCYANNPLCTPSRASIMTGQEVPEHGVCKLYDNLHPNSIFFTKHLQSLGYQTSLIGKLHTSSHDFEASNRHPHDGFDNYHWCPEDKIYIDSPFNEYGKWLKQLSPETYQQFLQNKKQDTYFDSRLHMTTWATEKTIELIHQKKTQPFFYLTSIFDPHNPYLDYPKEMEEKIHLADIPNPICPHASLESSVQQLQYAAKYTHKHTTRDISHELLMKYRYGYAASIAFIDINIGKIIDALKKTNQLENTLFLFTSDHGDMLGDHGLMVKGAYFYDPCVKVPLIAHCPTLIQAGQTSKQLIQLNDLSNLILESAGMALEKRQELLPSTRDISYNHDEKDKKIHHSQKKERDHIISVYRNSGLSFKDDRTPYFAEEINATMIKDQQFKLIHYQQTKSFQANGQLFDQSNDPLEQNNLYHHSNFQSIKTKLLEKSIGWHTNIENKYLNSRNGQCLPQWFLNKK